MKAKIRLSTPMGTYSTDGPIELEAKTQLEFMSQCFIVNLWNDLISEDDLEKVDSLVLCAKDRQNTSYEFVFED